MKKINRTGQITVFIIIYEAGVYLSGQQVLHYYQNVLNYRILISSLFMTMSLGLKWMSIFLCNMKKILSGGQ